VSHIAVLPPDSQQTVLQQVRSILRDHQETSGRPTLSVPYRVDVRYAERLR
jgi:hypothetical protein